MNILFVNCRYNLFDGIDCGAANRSTMFVKALTEISNVDIISFNKEAIRTTFQNCKVVFDKYIPNQNSKRQVLYRRLHTIFLPWTPKAYYLLNKERIKVVNNIYKKEKYDFVACRYIDDVVSCGLMRYADKLIVDVDDNLVNAMKRDATNWNQKHLWNRLITLWKIYNVGKMSKLLLSKVKYSFYSNILEPPYEKSIFLHNVTNISQTIPPIESSTPIRILIVGLLDFFPNKRGVLHFTQKVFPLIKKIVPDVELHIVGKSSDKLFLTELNSINGVKALGYVNDLSEEYRNCRVVIVPVYLGAGTSVKFVEGLMMNRPIVTTPMGVRGFENFCKEGVHYLLANTDEEFADNVIDLLKSVNKSNIMAHAAYCIGNDSFSQRCFFKIVKDTIK